MVNENRRVTLTYELLREKRRVTLSYELRSGPGTLRCGASGRPSSGGRSWWRRRAAGRRGLVRRRSGPERSRPPLAVWLSRIYLAGLTTRPFITCLLLLYAASVFLLTASLPLSSTGRAPMPSSPRQESPCKACGRRMNEGMLSSCEFCGESIDGERERGRVLRGRVLLVVRLPE